MFPSTTINIRGFKYCRDSDQQVILSYLAPPSVDIKSYFWFNLVCRHLKCFPSNFDCLVTHWRGLSLSRWLYCVGIWQSNHSRAVEDNHLLSSAALCHWFNTESFHFKKKKKQGEQESPCHFINLHSSFCICGVSCITLICRLVFTFYLFIFLWWYESFITQLSNSTSQICGCFNLRLALQYKRTGSFWASWCDQTLQSDNMFSVAV